MFARVARQAVIPVSHIEWRQLLSRLTGLLLSFTLLSMVGMAIMKLNDPQLLPIQKVRAQGSFINLTEQMLLKRAGDIRGGYFSINVTAVQKNIESLAWVDKAYVRRLWPDTLMITVTEQTASAWWQDDGLINQRGELFFPEKNSFPANLPKLNGPAGTHRQLLEHYQNMNSMLEKSALTIQRIDMDARRSLVIMLVGGVKILLGRDEYYPRLERFVRMHAKLLAAEMNNIQKIDMRYTNGFTLLRQQ